MQEQRSEKERPDRDPFPPSQRGGRGGDTRSSTSDPRNVLIYDAECRLCVSSKRWLERWDRRRRIAFLPFQTTEAKERVPDLAGMSCMDAMRFIDAEGKIVSGVEAFRKMLPLLPFGSVLSLLFYLPGVSWLAAKIYHHVAENRYRWFGRAH